MSVITTIRAVPAAAAWGLSLVLLAGCASNRATSDAFGTTVSPKPPLRVGVVPDLAPLVFKQDDKLAGLEIDLARALSQALQREPQFVELEWDELLPALLEGRVDIVMSGVTATPARRIRMAFSRPYFQSGLVALLRRGEQNQGQAALIQDKLKIGALRNTTGDHYIEQKLPRATRKTYSNPEEGAQALIAKEIDVFLSDSPIAWWLAAVHENNGLLVTRTLISKEEYAWAMRRDDQQLVDAVNAWLLAYDQDDRLLRAIRRWLPDYRPE